MASTAGQPGTDRELGALFAVWAAAMSERHASVP